MIQTLYLHVVVNHCNCGLNFLSKYKEIKDEGWPKLKTFAQYYTVYSK